jgi:hypothetical protein
MDKGYPHWDPWVNLDLTLYGELVMRIIAKMRVRIRRRDRLQILEQPLFSGHLFACTDLNEWACKNIISQPVFRCLW